MRRFLLQLGTFLFAVFGGMALNDAWDGAWALFFVYTACYVGFAVCLNLYADTYYQEGIRKGRGRRV